MALAGVAREIAVRGRPLTVALMSCCRALAGIAPLVVAITWTLAPLGTQGADLAASPPPVTVIFDTDISGDVDDVLALAMLHTLSDRGACELLAVTISKVNPLTGPFVDAVNTFYGRPDVPIGVTRQAQVRESRYLQLATAQDGEPCRYPHDLVRNEDAPEAVDLLRQVLAAQPEASVVVVQVGLAVNLARLLATTPDRHSACDGVTLVRQKVRLLSVMAGAFQPIPGRDRFLEANVRNDVPSMQTLARAWPTPVVWSGYEIGVAVPYPALSIQRDFRYVTHHPVAEAYCLYNPPPHERPTWDLSSVLYAVYPDRGYFDLSPAGRVTVADDGYSAFAPQPEGRDRFLVLSAMQAARVQEAFVQLVSQPPRGLEEPAKRD